MNRRESGFVRDVNRGFTLVEMLVSILIFSIVMIAVYALFDQGRWSSLHAERASNALDNGRLLLEQMERDLRMTGSGVPFGTEINVGTTWRPWIFEAAPLRIYFRSDIDNANSQLSVGETAGDTDIHVLDNSLFPVATKVVVQNRLRRWQAETVTGIGSDASGPFITVGTALAEDFDPGEGEVFTPEHVFYQFTSNAAYPFGIVERAIRNGNDPVNDILTAGLTWSTVATNIFSFELRFFALDGTELTGDPLAAAALPNVHRILATAVVRERARAVQQWQDHTFSSEIFVRSVKP